MIGYNIKYLLLESKRRILLLLIGCILSSNALASQAISFKCNELKKIDRHVLSKENNLELQISSQKIFKKFEINNNKDGLTQSWLYSNGVLSVKTQGDLVQLDLNLFKKKFNKFNSTLRKNLSEELKTLALEYKINIFLTGSKGELKLTFSPQLSRMASSNMSFSFFERESNIEGSFTLANGNRVIRSLNRYVEVDSRNEFMTRSNLRLKTASLNYGIICNTAKVIPWSKIDVKKISNSSLYDLKSRVIFTQPGIFSRLVFDSIAQFFIAKRQDLYLSENNKELEMKKLRKKVSDLLSRTKVLSLAPWNNKKISKEKRQDILNANIALYAQKYPYRGIGSFDAKEREELYRNIYLSLKY
jgi:hypothetical protein